MAAAANSIRKRTGPKLNAKANVRPQPCRLLQRYGLDTIVSRPVNFCDHHARSRKDGKLPRQIPGANHAARSGLQTAPELPCFIPAFMTESGNVAGVLGGLRRGRYAEAAEQNPNQQYCRKLGEAHPKSSFCSEETRLALVHGSKITLSLLRDFLYRFQGWMQDAADAKEHRC